MVDARRLSIKLQLILPIFSQETGICLREIFRGIVLHGSKILVAFVPLTSDSVRADNALSPLQPLLLGS
jgi:hypothetical protein